MMYFLKYVFMMYLYAYLIYLYTQDHVNFSGKKGFQVGKA